MTKKHRLTESEMKSVTTLLQPTRPFFCTTKDEDGGDHIAPFAWMVPASVNPPRVSISLQNENGRKLSDTLKNILRTGEFVINMPTGGQEQELVRASFMLEEKYGCKFERTGFHAEESGAVAPVSVLECPASVECRVNRVIDHGGDHTLIIADIVGASIREECYGAGLAPELPEMLPLINLKEKRFDDHQEHWFIEAAKIRHFTVYYDEDKRGSETNVLEDC